MGAAALPTAGIGAALSLASMGMKAGSDVASGYATQQQDAVKGQNYLYQGQTQQEQFGITSKQDLMQASQADTAAEFGKLQSDMTDAAAREGLTKTLGNITTMRLAGGADLTSPTTAALQGHVTNIAEMNREAAVSSIDAQTAYEKSSSDYLHQASAFALTQGQDAMTMGKYNANAENIAGSNAVTSGFLNSATDILGGLGKAFATGGGK